MSKSALLFINVQTIRKHPQFQGLAYTHLGYDIAVLKLERQVWAFTPVCLAKPSEVDFLNFDYETLRSRYLGSGHLSTICLLATISIISLIV